MHNLQEFSLVIGLRPESKGLRLRELLGGKLRYVVIRQRARRQARSRAICQMGKSFLVVDKGRRLGGVSVHTGTIPSDGRSSILAGRWTFFVNNIFNYPTLAEAYKIARRDAWNRMGAA